MHIPGTHRTMRYLSTVIILGDRRNCLALQQHVKATGLPLTVESAHPPSAAQWPVSQLRAAIQNSSTRTLANASIKALCTWYSAAGIPKTSISEWVQKARYTTRIKHQSRTDHICIWFPLPWHPAWAIVNPMSYALRDVSYLDFMVKRASIGLARSKLPLRGRILVHAQ